MAPPVSRSKRLLFAGVLLVLLALAVEVAAFAGYWILEDERFSWSILQADRRAVIEQFDTAAEPGFEAAAEVLHPFLGYVPNPDRDGSLSEFGYPGTTVLTAEPGDDRVVVAVVGGSVAYHLASRGLPGVIDRLASKPEWAGRRIVIANLAVGGYKQPQQLITLNYLLALGYRLDVVVNIDGFNEVALHAAENARKRVFPIFPRAWYSRVSAIPDRRLRARVGRLAWLEERIVDAARGASGPPWRWSVTSNLIWRFRHRRLMADHAVAEVAFRRYEPADSPYLVTGPRVDLGGEDELYRHLVEIWKRSSLQMDRLCRANGILYYHFLQPNQYVPGAKQLTDEELEVAFNEEHPYRAGAERGYPLLARAGAALVAEGVRFADLTGLFADERRTIYSDDCCHYNQLGNDLVAGRVAERILQSAALDLANFER